MGEYVDSNGRTQQYSTKEVVISLNASLTAIIDLQAAELVGIIIPATWTTANLTFQGAQTVDGTAFDIYDSAGNELVAVAAASRLITDLPELKGVRFLKVRSGTTGTPVAQAAARTLLLILK